METLQIQNDLLNISEIKISYQPKFKASERPQISCSKQGYEIMKVHWNVNTIAFQEEFKIFLLNRNNRLLGVYHVGTGGMSGVFVDAKLVFCAALKAVASSIILFHNHPSGNLKPSTADIQITNRLIQIGKFMDMPILDHIIITPDDGYYSFADEGLI
ncbi:JAB domain-containing protein [Pedobacter sp. N36a]|uniref:JAB domain-containing protein n=1 Tax=Pedobacter sp. N36a TaxID=2767996 RepID=UPI001656D63B|nr:JAB domain-containing protein [Pedobacter sp. N36a]MBC8986693.1 JAB domain-containing protein [Pedobacter sp. N36a]